MAILKLGDQGPEVRRLQLLLNSALIPSPRLEPDGDFGPRTSEALLTFQRARKLGPDGIAGPRTWFALGQKTVIRPPTVVEPKADSRWMAIAEAELGVHEDSLPGQHTRRIIEYHATTTLRATADEVPWCSSFINWVLAQAGHRGTRSAAARSWLDWGSRLESARLGAITVIKRRGASSDAATGSSSGFHVGLFVSATPTHIRLLGGNQGDQVRYSNFRLTSYEIRAHRWPA